MLVCARAPQMTISMTTWIGITLQATNVFYDGAILILSFLKYQSAYEIRWQQYIWKVDPIEGLEENLVSSYVVLIYLHIPIPLVVGVLVARLNPWCLSPNRTTLVGLWIIRFSLDRPADVLMLLRSVDLSHQHPECHIQQWVGSPSGYMTLDYFNLVLPGLYIWGIK